MGTLIVSLILIVIIAGIIFSMIKKKRSGKHIISCGGSCSSCNCNCSHRTNCAGCNFNQNE
ncbi:MAG: FeoB-associated Cys-rich membrane protein [Treponema sp.]|nr:FeoB-associated Cys-rich membrane protein [Treponema sp.]